MAFRPLHDRVVVRRIEAEEKSKGGIIIPDTAKEKPQEGEIIAVGPGARDEAGAGLAEIAEAAEVRAPRMMPVGLPLLGFLLPGHPRPPWPMAREHGNGDRRC